MKISSDIIDSIKNASNVAIINLELSELLYLALFSYLSVDIVQALEKRLILRLLANGVDPRGNHPYSHASLRAHHQQINDHLVVCRLLACEREETNQQARIQKIPFIVGKTQPLGEWPSVQGTL